MKAFAAAAALAVLVPAAALADPPSYPVRLFSFGFEPSPIALHASEPVTLVFTNSSGSSHEFKATEFFHSAKILAGTVTADGSIELKGHASASVTLIPARGSYEAHCGHFMHQTMGMKTRIEVN